MVIDTAKLKISTKTMVAFFTVFGGVMQVPVVNQFVAAVTASHKNAASLVAALIGIAALLHNPEIQDALGMGSAVRPVETGEQNSLVKDAK